MANDFLSRNEGSESERLRLFFRSLFELTSPELLSLAERIHSNNGVTHIYVHQFFDQYVKRYHPELYTISPENSLILEKAREIFRKILTKQPANTIHPIFLFEEADRMDETREILSSYPAVEPNTAYLIPTYENSSEPRPDPTRKRSDPRNWKELVDLFSRLNVKRIFVNGMVLAISDQVDLRDLSELLSYYQQRSKKGPRNLGYTILGCQRETVAELSKHFDIEITNFNFPFNRKDINRIESGF